jgi:hypothetical protein
MGMRERSLLPLAGVLLAAVGVTACSGVVEPGGAGGGASSSASTASGCGPACEPASPWSVSYDVAGWPSTALAVATDPSGNVFTTGDVGANADFGAGALIDPYGGGYLLGLDPEGHPLFARLLVEEGAGASITDLAVDAAGDVYVVGNLQVDSPPLDFGAGPLVSTGSLDVFLVKLDGAGHTLWSVKYGTEGVEYPIRLAVGPWGEVAVVGGFDELGASAAHGFFVAAFGPTGDLLWDRRIPTGILTSSNGAVAVDGAGNVAITGNFTGHPDLGTGALGAPGRMFAAMYDASGLPLWSEDLGGPGDARPDTIACDAAGDVVIAGVGDGDADFGGGALGGPASQAFVVKLDHHGKHLWSEALWPSFTFGAGLALTADGGVIAAGPSGPAPDGTTALAVRLLDPDGGVHLQHDHHLSLGYVANVAVAVAPAGGVMLAGSYSGTLDLGSGQHESSDYTTDIFVARLAP